MSQDGRCQARRSAPRGDEARQDGPYRDRVGDQAAALGGVQLPVARVLLEEVVGVVGVEVPFDPTPRRIRLLRHVDGVDGAVHDGRWDRVLLG